MNFLNKLERRFGRYAIRNLSAVIIGLYAAGYLLAIFSPSILSYLTLEPYFILRGQVWRILTWVIVPPGSLGIFTVIMLFFYYSIGQVLERTWGAFRFNFYIFSGIIFTVLGAFVLYGITLMRYGVPRAFGGYFSTYYINMSIFLAFAVSYPDMQVLLYFIIPVKMKWMGILYGALVLVSMVQGDWVARVAIIASLLNFIIFFMMTQKGNRTAGNRNMFGQGGFGGGGPGRQPGYGSAANAAGARRAAKASSASSGSAGTSGARSGPMHRCTICGRTELDGDHLVFRYCSKCDGAYEYCQDHLFNHEHRHA